MIGAFRKKRKAMINKRKIFRYSSYAIGEIVLVVIGILIALQINNYNERRKALELEQKYLKELKEDLVSDSIRINSVFRSIDGHIEAAEVLLEWIEENEFIDSLTMTKAMIEAMYMSFFDANLSTYNEMINSGNLKILNDKELKDKLDQYISYLKQIETRYELNKQTVWFDYGRYIRSNYIDGRLFSQIYMDEINSLQTYPVNWEKIKKDQDLKQMLTNIISTAYAEKRWHTSTLNQITGIINLLDTLIR